jgi:multimeric flavodoxin WrbA
MKALMLNGSKQDDPILSDIMKLIIVELKNAGWQVETIDLKNKQITTCKGCFGCWHESWGQCIINDDAQEIIKAVVQSDLLVLLTPVYFGCYSYELKKAIDRLFTIIIPKVTIVDGEVHQSFQYEQYPKLLAIGTVANADDEIANVFDRLVTRNSISFRSPAHTSGTITLDMGGDEIRLKVMELLKNVRVTA